MRAPSRYRWVAAQALAEVLSFTIQIWEGALRAHSPAVEGLIEFLSAAVTEKYCRGPGIVVVGHGCSFCGALSIRIEGTCGPISSLISREASPSRQLNQVN